MPIYGYLNPSRDRSVASKWSRIYEVRKVCRCRQRSTAQLEQISEGRKPPWRWRGICARAKSSRRHLDSCRVAYRDAGTSPLVPRKHQLGLAGRLVAIKSCVPGNTRSPPLFTSSHVAKFDLEAGARRAPGSANLKAAGYQRARSQVSQARSPDQGFQVEGGRHQPSLWRAGRI